MDIIIATSIIGCIIIILLQKQFLKCFFPNRVFKVIVLSFFQLVETYYVETS